MNKHMPKAAGELSVLNVGDGDTKLSFDPKNPAERIRAARIVADMIKRGYALLVEVTPGVYQRATAFDETKCEYVIADFDPITAAEHDEKEEHEHEHEEAVAGSASAAGAKAAPRGRRVSTRTIPAAGTKAVAVGRTAGG